MYLCGIYASAADYSLGVPLFVSFLIGCILSSEIAMLTWNLDVVDWHVQFRELISQPRSPSAWYKHFAVSQVGCHLAKQQQVFAVTTRQLLR